MSRCHGRRANGDKRSVLRRNVQRHPRGGNKCNATGASRQSGKRLRYRRQKYERRINSATSPTIGLCRINQTFMLRDRMRETATNQVSAYVQGRYGGEFPPTCRVQWHG